MSSSFSGPGNPHGEESPAVMPDKTATTEPKQPATSNAVKPQSGPGNPHGEKTANGTAGSGK